MANTLNLGNGNWATKEDSLLAYNSENGNYKPLPFDFTRASSATVVNKAGLIETVGSGEPRIDFSNDANGALLLEPTRSNLISYSEDFSDAYWVKATVSLSSNQIISPNGALDADKITESSTNGLQQVYSDVITTTTSSDYVYSIFIKKGERSWVKVMTANNNGANFNVEDGIIGIVDGGINAKIEDYGNGWFKCSVSFNTSASADRVYVRIGTSNGVNSYQGDGTSGIYIWGAQLSSYPTSYIPTQGSAVTRVADVCNNGGNEQVINSTEGVLYAEISASISSDFKSLSLSNGSSSGDDNRVMIGFQNSILYVNVRVGNAYQFNENLTIPIDNNNKIALKYKPNDFALWINGNEVKTDNNGTTFSAGILTKMQFADGRPTTSPFYGNVKDVRVYNTALTDAELQALTT